MPRYFFHSKDRECYTDEIGIELPDLASARKTAFRYAGEILRDTSEITVFHGIEVIVVNEQGHQVFNVAASVSDTEG